MPLAPRCRVAVHFDRLKNVDLFQQGWYCVRVQIASPHIQGKVFASTFEVANNRSYHSLPRLPPRDPVLETGSSQYYTHAYWVHYRDEVFQSNAGVVFEFSLASLASLDETVVLQFELLFSAEEGFSASRSLPCVATREARLQLGPASLRRYLPLTFDDYHYCLYDVGVHAAVVALDVMAPEEAIAVAPGGAGSQSRSFWSSGRSAPRPAAPASPTSPFDDLMDEILVSGVSSPVPTASPEVVPTSLGCCSTNGNQRVPQQAIDDDLQMLRSKAADLLEQAVLLLASSYEGLVEAFTEAVQVAEPDDQARMVEILSKFPATLTGHVELEVGKTAEVAEGSEMGMFGNGKVLLFGDGDQGEAKSVDEPPRGDAAKEAAKEEAPEEYGTPKGESPIEEDVKEERPNEKGTPKEEIPAEKDPKEEPPTEKGTPKEEIPTEKDAKAETPTEKDPKDDTEKSPPKEASEKDPPKDSLDLSQIVIQEETPPPAPANEPKTPETVKQQQLKRVLVAMQESLTQASSRVGSNIKQSLETLSAQLDGFWAAYIEQVRSIGHLVCRHDKMQWVATAGDPFSLNFFFDRQPADAPHRHQSKLEDAAKLRKQARPFPSPLYDGVFHDVAALPIFYIDLLEDAEDTVPMVDLPSDRHQVSGRSVHLWVFVHGFQGNSFDLRSLKNEISLFFPHNSFLCSRANEQDTHRSIAEMGLLLAQEIIEHIEQENLTVAKLSFVGHSLGNIIARAAIATPLLHPYRNKFFTFMSLSGPHLGTCYNSNFLVDTAMKAWQRWAKSTCLRQLTLADGKTVDESYIFQLSSQPGLEYFENVVLVSSDQDGYVPLHSARWETPASLSDNKMGRAYSHMLDNLLTRTRGRNLIRVNVVFQLLNNDLDRYIGRSAHIRFLEDQAWMRMLVSTNQGLFA